MRARERRIVSSAWQQAVRRGGRSTIGAAVLATAGALLAFVILHRADVGGVVVQVTLAALVLLAFFVASLVVIAAQIERQRDEANLNLYVFNARVGVSNAMRIIAADCRLEL